MSLVKVVLVAFLLYLVACFLISELSLFYDDKRKGIECRVFLIKVADSNLVKEQKC